MIILKQVIHYPDNSVEATWVERTLTPQPEVPEVPGTPAVEYQPAVVDDLGVETQPEVLAQDAVPGTPAYTPDPTITDVQIKCHSYADVQMQMFRDDAEALGTPLDDYEDMIAEVEANIVPYVPPPPVVPQVISIRQACQVLESVGLLDDIEAAIAQAPRYVQIDWRRATTVERNWPTLIAMQASLGLTDQQLDALFIQAATL